MKLVVIGGVAAGMSAAARARRLDERAEIVVLERGKHVSFANCGLPYHIGGVIRDRDDLLLQTPDSLRTSLNLDVRVGHEAVKIVRDSRRVVVREVATGRGYEENYDKLILCPGAQPVRPPLVGCESSKCFVLRNIEDMDRIKAAVDSGAKRAIVIGAGYIGVEMAENLKNRGLEVNLIEMVDQILPFFDAEMVRDLEFHMRVHGVTLHLGTQVTALREAEAHIEAVLSGGKVLAADFAVLAVGVRPDVSLARDAGLEIGPCGGIKVDAQMRTSDPDIYAAGDAVEVVDAVTGQPALFPLAGPANRQGRVAAENVCGRNTVYPGTQGTAILKVFDMTAAMTGTSEKTLKRLKRPYCKVYLHPSDHAGYYPGSAPMQIKLLFAPDSGRI